MEAREDGAETCARELRQRRDVASAVALGMSGTLRAGKERGIGALYQCVRDLHEEEAAAAVAIGRLERGVADAEERLARFVEDDFAAIDPAIGKAIEARSALSICDGAEQRVRDAFGKAGTKLWRKIEQRPRGGEQIVGGEGARGEGCEEGDVALVVHVPLHVGETGGEVAGG